VSGSGGSLKTWHETVAPFLVSADIAPRLVVTTHAGHAGQTVSEMDSAALLQLLAVVVVGGDGLLYEVWVFLFCFLPSFLSLLLVLLLLLILMFYFSSFSLSAPGDETWPMCAFVDDNERFC
jgi:hypothetical protein